MAYQATDTWAFHARPEAGLPPPRDHRDVGAIRLADLLIAACGLLFLLPLLLLIALAVRMTSPGPVLFGHKRIGRSGVPFRCFKFRTMAVDAEQRLAAILASDPEKRAAWERDQKLVDDPRITWLGKYLRVSSLDELPQFWNVLCGDMSIVGPRPIVAAEVPRYGRYIVDYLSTRPGITGLWQVSGRSDVTYRRRVAMDVVFARRQTFRQYVVILVMTVPAVLLKRGSY